MDLPSWLQDLIKIKPSDTRNLARHEMLESPPHLNEAAQKSNSAASKPRVPGTRWLPPPQVAAPVLAVKLGRPDRLTADYNKPDMREVTVEYEPVDMHELTAEYEPMEQTAECEPVDMHEVKPTDHPAVDKGLNLDCSSHRLGEPDRCL